MQEHRYQLHMCGVHQKAMDITEDIFWGFIDFLRVTGYMISGVLDEPLPVVQLRLNWMQIDADTTFKDALRSLLMIPPYIFNPVNLF